MTFSWFNVPCLTSLELGNNLAKHRAVLHPGPRHHQIAVASQESRQTAKQINASIISNTAYTVHVRTKIRPRHPSMDKIFFSKRFLQKPMSFRILPQSDFAKIKQMNISFCRRRQRYRSGPCTGRITPLNSSLGRLNA
ncbi:hypothetical protein I7I50_10467 [Histoplasma capsulatum G186AR]|uniref:Uncharacterized protein n=1 Tax=Ajellomyces capsulatus TaxID=5037 RepID=A0A8H7Z7M8_AJECA|nr:hypothetical protein I7I52_01706 [Histoplasma capsulatum]QSS69250.1 hypothetical protein I7I50_10467 [Histoplasma capsulatum G186AR]